VSELKKIRVQVDIILSVRRCETCGTIFAVQSEIIEKYADEGGFWSCPNGHQRGYAQARKDRAETKLAAQLEEARKAARIAEQQAAGLRAENERLKSTPVQRRSTREPVECPHCGRRVKGLVMHIRSAHPECVEVAA